MKKLSRMTNSGQAWTALKKRAGVWRVAAQPPFPNKMICVAIPHDHDTTLLFKIKRGWMALKKGVGAGGSPSHA